MLDFVQMSDRLIIGLSGPNGSGKDAVAKILADRHGFLFVGATEMFLGELHARGWPIDREHKSKLSAEWRRQYGMAVVVDKALDQFKASGSQYKGLVVSSLRHPGEADRIHELDGLVLWIDADPQVRYQRIISADRGRGLEDNKSFEAFLADEAREMTPSGDAATLNMAAVKQQSDQTLWNNTDSLLELEKELSNILARYNRA